MRFLLVWMMCMGLALSGAAGEEIRYMRVVARDDSPSAQREKMLVRDAAIACWPDTEKLEAFFPDCRVSERIWQPDKNTAPAKTVYITIGQGQGRNWWGVLYPGSACWAGGGRAGEEVQITFPVLSWLAGLFNLPAEWFAIE